MEALAIVTSTGRPAEVVTPPAQELDERLVLVADLTRLTGFSKAQNFFFCPQRQLQESFGLAPPDRFHRYTDQHVTCSDLYHTYKRPNI